MTGRLAESPALVPATSTGAPAKPRVSGIGEGETEGTETALINAYLSDPPHPTKTLSKFRVYWVAGNISYLYIYDT